MKRIVSLDILRGLSILGLVLFHAVEKTLQSGVVSNIYNQPPIQFVLFGTIFYFASWRGFFMIISGAANTFSYEKALQSGTNPFRIFLKQFIWSFLLLGWGVVIQLFFSPYGGLNDLIVDGNYSWDGSLSGLKWSDAVESIAVCLLITTVIQFVASSRKSKHSPILKIGIYLLLTIGIIFFQNNILAAFETTWGITPANVRSMPNKPFKEGFKTFWMGIIIGYQQPLIPYLGTFTIGNIFGILLSSKKIVEKKQQFLISSYVLGFLTIGVGFAIWIFRDKMYFAGDFMIPPDWFLIFSTGLQIIVFVAFLHAFDFCKKAARRVKHTKMLRRAGLISLTMFTLQPLDLIPRAFLNLFFEENFMSRGQLTFWQAALCGIVVLIFWIVVIILWGFVNYAFSIDYIFVILRRFISGSKIKIKDPLQSKEFINNPEPIFSPPPVSE